jgi:hypothetical protein
MKKFLPVFVLLLAVVKMANAQSVAVSAGNVAPHASAMLEVNSTEKGFLPPRMTTAQRDAIANPAQGLVIYNTTTDCLNYRGANAWLELCGTCSPLPTTAGAGADQLNLASTSATLAANTPVNGTGAWSIISGAGGSFANAASPTSGFNGVAGQLYTLRWTITTPCGSSGDNVDVGFVATGPNIISLRQLRTQYQGTNIKITTSTQITGTVISDTTAQNVSRGTVILQQGTNGMKIFFGNTATPTYNVGDSVLIDITGDSLVNFRGSLQVLASVSQLTPVIATGKIIQPGTRALGSIDTALNAPLGSAWHIENTLLKVDNVTLSGANPNYSGEKTMADGTGGNMILFTRTQASFANTTFPTTPSDFIGFAFLFDAKKEYQIRTLGDVQ